MNLLLNNAFVKLLPATVMVFVVSSFSLCAQGRDLRTRTVDKIAAVVGTEIVLYSEVLRKAAPQLNELKKAASSQNIAALMIDHRIDKITRQSLEMIIDDTLVRQQAVLMKVKVTTDEVDMAIENMARENGVDMETFRRALEAAGKDLITYKSEMRRDLLKYKVLNLRVRGRVSITEQEARKYYNDQVRDVRATGVFEGAHILIKVSRGAKALEVATKKKQAQKILDRIASGSTFEDVAEELSEDKATSSSGGRLGKKKFGELDASMDRAFLDMEQGEVAGPIRTTNGFHILKLIEREEMGVQPFDEVKNQIMNQLMQEEMIRQQKIWLKELRLRTFIDVRL